MKIIIFSCQIKIIRKFSNNDTCSLYLIVTLQIMLIYHFRFSGKLQRNKREIIKYVNILYKIYLL